MNGQEKLIIVYDMLDRVNFASAQNDVPIIRSISISNLTDYALTGVRIELRTAPSVIRNKTWTLDRIASGESVEVSDTSTELNMELLSGLDEAEIGEFEFRVEVDGCDPIVEKGKIELLARDEWGGEGMAAILAAFVYPNDATVATILRTAARLLEAAGHDGAMNGYQSNDPSRAYMLAGAIWSAATGLGLTYAEPPASFEKRGQKIRNPSRIINEGLATCLDTTLLLAGAFEAAGLHPVVLFSEGHAWVGVWIRKKDFGHVTEPDIVAVRKAAQALEFVPIETTLLTRRPSIDFERTVDEGRRRLSEECDPEFLMAVDIARSRSMRIRPLASHSIPEAVNASAEDEVAPAALPRAPDFNLLPGEEQDETLPKTSQGRIERWQRKLLDFSLKNRLLNYRDSKQTLPLFCPNVAALEDQLAAGQDLSMLSLNDEDPVGNRELSLGERQRIEEQFARDAFEGGQIVVPLTDQEMNNRLLMLHRRAKSDIQEGGTNTLFLVAGFLKWKKMEGDLRTYRAPLLLIPVKLGRQTARSPFKITHHDDDVQINSTLLQLLRQNFELQIPEFEGKLPRDDSGIDVPRIFEIMRQKVHDINGFEIVEGTALATFSFTKYLMWKDLVDRTDQLRQNRLVRYLIDGGADTYHGVTENPPVTLKKTDRQGPDELFTPLPADSSQLGAVIAASEGHDFILIGPPGTGKSQTIANIISQCIGEGKTVLFLAEKAAALDVVHRRLVAIGIGDAVLELHSNKTDRKSVITQLGRGWDRASGAVEEQWVEVTQELMLHRDKLNAYVKALHARGTQGFSVFEAVGRVVTGEGAFTISYASKDAHDVQNYKRLVTLAADLDRVYKVVGSGPVLSMIGCEQWSHQWERDMLTAVAALRQSLSNLKQAESALTHELGLRTDQDLSVQRRSCLKALTSRVAQDTLDISLVPDMSPEALVDQKKRLVADISEITAARSEMKASYPLSQVLRMPLETFDTDWREAQTKIWPLSFFAQRRIRKLLQTYADNGETDPDIDLNVLFKVRKWYEVIRKNPLMAANNTENLDTTQLMKVTDQAVAFRRVEAMLRDVYVEDTARFGTAVTELVSVRKQTIRDVLTAYLDAEKAVTEKQNFFISKGGEVPAEASVTDLDAGLATIIAERVRLADWVRWVEKRNNAVAVGLSPLVEALENGMIEETVNDAFERAYAAWWLPLAMDASDELRQFVYWEHEDVIKTFCQLDDQVAQLASVEVMRRITHGLPARDDVPRHSELGTLRHQLSLVRPSMPIRQLLESLSETFGKLAPCVLMSPLSSAQYLSAKQATFDIAVLDEASQITTWDAIGAIARARQTIIVGDPKQLPPTNFFGRADDDGEEVPEAERDMPSILDEADVAGVPRRRLNWHYRSRDEALIAFSNCFYYDGKLVTFPAPTTRSEALKFHYIEGTYARGHGRTNAQEAKAVTDMVKRRLTAWLALSEQKRPTLGVITFNSEQQSLILDMFDTIRREDERLEWFFSDEREEPVIVKNLENIQGDERDVMIISITFGPDMAGKLTMNFGPLNNMGGEKRLNVAVTRARQEFHIFASIRAEQIDLSRTKATGVQHLKSFLDYSERGASALPSGDEGAVGSAADVFESAVADAFRRRGWEVHTQVGVAGFRVDIGVVHPDRTGCYLAGIECDGARYHSSATARDRDKVRQRALEGSGWTILRIWSTDWFRSSQAVIDRIHAAMEEILKDDREAVAKEKTEAQST